MKLAYCTDNKIGVTQYTYEEWKHDYDDQNFDDAVKPRCSAHRFRHRRYTATSRINRIRNELNSNFRVSTTDTLHIIVWMSLNLAPCIKTNQ